MVTKNIKMEAKRHPVARGGMWNTPQATYSKQTQDMMKEMMKESKLTNFQQRQLKQVLSDGSTLPTKVHPTTSAKAKLPPPQVVKGPRVDPRAPIPQVRSKEQIESSGAYERDQYAPKPLTRFGGFYEKDKQRLANIMAYGEDLRPPDMNKIIAMARRNLAPKKEVDRFEELQKELAERESFLGDMESLGQGEKYRQIIATESSQLLREMEVIDQKRTTELNKLLEEHKKENSK